MHLWYDRHMNERTTYNTIYTPGTGESVEKKSRFLGVAEHVTSEEEALALVDAIRKEHYDARHHCFAYVIGTDGKTMRAADDGEPQGTAGRPMLDLLIGAGLCDAIVVVTRYFGGTLLGTGGLVRNYAAAAQAALDASRIIEKKPGCRATLRADYTDVGKIQHLLGELQIPQIDSAYGEDVTFELIVPDEIADRFRAALTEATAGRAALRYSEETYYSVLDGEVILS